MAKLVSKVYGEALYEIAASAGTQKELMDEIRSLQLIILSNPDFDKMMLHPGIPKQEKLETIDKVFKGRVSDTLAGFLRTVADKERYAYLDSIFQYYIAKVKENEGIGIAYVTSAAPLNDKQKDDVMKKLLETTEYKSMEMHYDTDPALIGGMTIRIKDRVVDSSVRTKIDKLTRQLMKIQLG